MAGKILKILPTPRFLSSGYSFNSNLDTVVKEHG